ncbi:MAG: hypothetical protein JWN14_4958 [Chthonomonadales bacterium]|nr:hypothetical protein [Chthonomonadales bacterium]
MAKRKVYEGTWAEISAHAEELQRYTKLTLIIPADEENTPVNTAMNLAEALKGYIGTASFGEANLSEDTGKKFARLLVEKYEKEQR